MFERFYTTKMSTSGKELRFRFERIRRGKGRSSRFAGVIMAAVMTAVLACGTVVMAAVGADGFEYWDTNEVYFLDGTSVSMSVAGQNVPEWVYEDITDDGNINVALKRYQVRGTDGWVQPMNLIEIGGNKGKATLASSGDNRGRSLTDPFDPKSELIRDNAMWLKYRFIEFSGEEWRYFREKLYGSFISPVSGKHRGADLTFVISDDWRIEKAILEFTVKDECDNETVACSSCIELPYSSFADFGFENSIRDNYIMTSNFIFMQYESQYKNLDVDGVKISVASASQDGIEVNIKNELPDIAQKNIEIYNEHGSFVSVETDDNDKLSGTFTVKPEQFPEAQNEWEQESQTGKFLSGHTYKVIAALINSENKVVYRWQDYVTIP